MRLFLGSISLIVVFAISAAGDDISATTARATVVHRSGVVWNTVLNGFKNSIYIHLRRTDDPKLLVVYRFFWSGDTNYFLQKLSPEFIIGSTIKAINHDEIYLNLTDGYLYLQNNKVGEALAITHSDPDLNYGFKFYQLRVDVAKNEIEVIIPTEHEP